MSKFNAKILIADDVQVSRETVKLILEKSGYQVVEVKDGQEGIDTIDASFDVAIVDLMMPGVGGLEFLKFIKKEFPLTQVVVLSGMGKISDVINVIREGAYWYLPKPIESQALKAIVEKAMEHRSLFLNECEIINQEEASLNNSEFFGNSEVVLSLISEVEQIAPLNCNVLIQGEDGVGKRSISRVIHCKSSRKNGPYVAIDCRALEVDRLEAELFGYERGAVTGALSARPGKLEIANKGTLVLNFVEEMPIDLQNKLFNVLESKKCSRIGGKDVRDIDVRFLATSSPNFEELCNQKVFNRDLYTKLSVGKLSVPSLKERMEDIEIIAQELLRRIGGRMNKSFSINQEAISALQKHEFSGNVRELENICEMAVATCTCDVIELKDLKLELSNNKSAKEAGGVSIGGMTLADIERLALYETLKLCKGNKAAAARILEISEKSIYNKMKRLGMRD